MRALTGLWSIFFSMVLVAQTPYRSSHPTPVEARIQGLVKDKQWGALADVMETSSPQEKRNYLVDWLEALNRAQRWQRLLELCEEVIPALEATSGPKLGMARLLRPKALHNLKRHIEAAEAYLENGRLGDSHGMANALAVTSMSRDWLRNIQVCERVLALNAGNSEAVALKGEALSMLGRFKEAEPLLEAALQKLPKRASCWAALSGARQDRKALLEGLEAADKACQLDPNLLEARYNRARVLMELKRYGQSRDDLVAAMALNPEPAMAAVLKTDLEATDRHIEELARLAAKTAKSKGKKL